MLRRDFFGNAAALAAGLMAPLPGALVRTDPAPAEHPRQHGDAGPDEWRSLFPRMEQDVFLNAAGGTPLALFAEDALLAYRDFWKMGGADGRDGILRDTLSSIRSEFAGLIGVGETEIALVSSTKEGEQIVLDSLRPWEDGGHVLTNVFHFSGSLHSYEGHRRAGRDVRIMDSDGWHLDVEKMLGAIDDDTRLVALSLVSNVNGRIEDVKAIAGKAHAHGALVFADIIQAAGIHPLNVRELGIDAASCSAYKWLYGPHGVGFLYVREGLQGGILADRLFPGHTLPQSPPWGTETQGGLEFTPPAGASRYEPGHHSYLGYACTLAGLRFIRENGVERISDHCLALADLARERIDTNRFPCISPEPVLTPIVAFDLGDADPIPALIEHDIDVSVSAGRLRVSPGVYNNEDDILRLAAAINSI